MFKTFYGQVLPSLPEAASSRLTVIFRPQIQPWHPSSTLAIEAALAVLKLAPAKFQQFSAALFEHQKEYFDANVVNETRNQTYERLAKLASKEAGVDEEAVMGLLRISDKPGAGGDLNGGNGVTADVKIMTKVRGYERSRGLPCGMGRRCNRLYTNDAGKYRPPGLWACMLRQQCSSM